jgi:hypothetical protein
MKGRPHSARTTRGSAQRLLDRYWQSNIFYWRSMATCALLHGDATSQEAEFVGGEDEEEGDDEEGRQPRVVAHRAFVAVAHYYL